MIHIWQLQIALIQVATCDNVFLFRITKFADKQIPTTLRDILENPDIIKVWIESIKHDNILLFLPSWSTLF